MRRHLARLILVLSAALILAACDSTAPTSPTPGLGTPAASSDGASPSGSAGPSSAAGSASPSAGRTPSAASPSSSGTPRPSASATPTPFGSGGPDPAAACAGSDSNRAFFRDVATAVPWDVYCPVLPAGWFVDAGSFRAASGGRMVISYKGPGGVRIELKEGAFCTGTPAECGPLDTSLGTAFFGDRQGGLGQFAGNLVLYVNPGTSAAWQATGTGFATDAFRTICAALVKVEG